MKERKKNEGSIKAGKGKGRGGKERGVERRDCPQVRLSMSEETRLLICFMRGKCRGRGHTLA